MGLHVFLQINASLRPFATALRSFDDPLAVPDSVRLPNQTGLLPGTRDPPCRGRVDGSLRLEEPEEEDPKTTTGSRSPFGNGRRTT